jgi:hypothetical protein
MYELTDNIKVFERHDWNARPWRNFTFQNLPTEAFIHHGAEGGAERVDTFAEQVQAMQETQAFHMNTRDPLHGWSDIAYHYVIFQSYHKGVHARIFEGRPVHHVPAAQLMHNTGTFAVCIYGNFQNDDEFKDNTRWALDLLLSRDAGQTGNGALKTVGGHRDVVQTSCPGDTIYRQLDAVANASGLKRYK